MSLHQWRWKHVVNIDYFFIRAHYSHSLRIRNLLIEMTRSDILGDSKVMMDPGLRTLRLRSWISSGAGRHPIGERNYGIFSWNYTSHHSCINLFMWAVRAVILIEAETTIDFLLHLEWSLSVWEWVRIDLSRESGRHFSFLGANGCPSFNLILVVLLLDIRAASGFGLLNGDYWSR